MKKIITIILLIISITLSAQEKPTNKGSIYGKIIDQSTKETLEFSNVILKSAKDNTIINGTITDNKGNFKISNIPYGNYNVEIVALGYETKTIFDIKLDVNNTFINLKTISISIAAEILGEVEIVEQVNDVEYKLDKKVVRVNQDIVSAGATAVEVLENIPSVSTDIDGNVSLRGSESFLVLIDGRPSPLSGSEALQQIPASSIETIEIITNPSAKYAADGVGGIINIIMKKDKRKGYNGQFSVNYGSFNSWGVDALFNFRLEKINFFVGGQFGMRNNKGEGKSTRETYLNKDTTLFLKTNSENKMNGFNGNIRAGFDWYVTDNDIITISGKYNQYKRARNADQFNNNYFTDFQELKFNENFYKNETKFDLHGGYYSGDINYFKKFKKAGHELQTYFNFASDFDDENNEYSQYNTDNEWNKYSDIRNNANRTTTNYSGRKYNAKIDYVLPLMKQAKFEAGWDMQYSVHDNDYKYFKLQNENFDSDETMHNPYIFTNNVQSVYTLFSDIKGKFGYQLGLRYELTDRTFDAKDSTYKYSDAKEFYKNLFPSIHLSYELPRDMQIMLSYSRRLSRPPSHFLDPFIEIQDANNIRMGNPELKPEYTNSFELNFQKKIKSHFFSIELFARQNSHKMDRITTIHQDYDSVFVSTFDNIGEDISSGIEIMANVNIFKWWNLNLTGNTAYYQIISDNYGSKPSVNWNLRMNNTWRITKWGTMIQFGANYRAPQITAQGKRYGSFMSNFGLRQDFLNRNLSVTLSLRDIFRTGTWKNESNSIRFYQKSENRRFSPSFNISVTYKLNDFQKRKDKSTEDNIKGDDDM